MRGVAAASLHRGSMLIDIRKVFTLTSLHIRQVRRFEVFVETLGVFWSCETLISSKWCNFEHTRTWNGTRINAYKIAKRCKDIDAVEPMHEYEEKLPTSSSCRGTLICSAFISKN
jgi:hypothetical protein